jgi:hypothetical protein
MTFKYQDYFDAAPSTGYETLIYDCMIGDAILFQRADGIEAGWRVVQPFLDAWRNVGPSGLAVYKAGSEGPAEADRLLAPGRPALAADCLRPEQVKTSTMPTDNSLRLCDHQGIHNAWRNPIEAGKNETIEIAKGEPLRRFSSQHIELVAQRHDLRLERGS